MKMLMTALLASYGTAAPAQLVSAQIDYPPAAFLAGIEGTTRYEVQLTPGGKVAACRIVETSGNAGLDKATCQQLRKTGRFTPGVDAAGAPVSSSYTGEMRWKLGAKH